MCSSFFHMVIWPAMLQSVKKAIFLRQDLLSPAFFILPLFADYSLSCSYCFSELSSLLIENDYMFASKGPSSVHLQTELWMEIIDFQINKRPS